MAEVEVEMDSDVYGFTDGVTRSLQVFMSTTDGEESLRTCCLEEAATKNSWQEI